jgi:hypothetical protein
MRCYLAEKMGLAFDSEQSAPESIGTQTQNEGNLDNIIADIQSLSDEDILKAFLEKK